MITIPDQREQLKENLYILVRGKTTAPGALIERGGAVTLWIHVTAQVEPGKSCFTMKLAA